MLSALDHALADSGHRSVVVGCDGSRVAGTLIPAPRTCSALIDEDRRVTIHAKMRDTIADAIYRLPIDVLVHMHGFDFYVYPPPPGPPTLITLHLPPEWYPTAIFQIARPKTWLNCVSRSQDIALRRIANGITVRAPIRNGVPIEKLSASRHARRRFALTLGRICPEKGQHLAVDAARTAGVPLLIAGQVFPYAAHQAYFETKIMRGLDFAAPLDRSDRVQPQTTLAFGCPMPSCA